MKPRMSVARCCCGVAPVFDLPSEVRWFLPATGSSGTVIFDEVIWLVAHPLTPSYLLNTHTFHWYASVAIPNSATIVSAKIVSMVNDVSGTDRTVNISLHDVDSSDNTSLANPASWPRTVSTTWNATASDTETTDFSASLQEVIDRPGWVSGNNIVIFFESSGGIALPSPHDRLEWSSTTLEVVYV